MVTVKDVIFLLKDVKRIDIVWDGCTRQVNPDDDLDVDAYGRYAVKQIVAFSPHEYELTILVQPVRA